MAPRGIITNSSSTCFRDCPRKYLYRYERGLKPVNRRESPALLVGTAVHSALDILHTYEGAFPVALMREDYGLTDNDLVIVSAMLTSYGQRMEIPKGVCETEFNEYLINPVTGRTSRSFRYCGKVDMISGSDLWEHKTASQITGSYLDKLWTDSQIIGYVWAMRGKQHIGRVVYNVLQKPRLRRKDTEAIETYAKRVAKWYLEKNRFHRERIIVGGQMVATWQYDLWAVTQEILRARKVGFRRNTARCFDWGRACAYLPVCQAVNPEMVLEIEYEETERHPELSEETKREK